MKFLCVPCDKPMKLQRTLPPDRGSITLVYACADCGYEMAMLTNPLETQVVGSLGVKVSPGAGEAAAAASKCPFSAVAREATEGPQLSAAGCSWTAGARARLANIPEFVRPMAETGIERFARERGYAQVDERVLDEAKDFFGM
ncbi:MAG TPA: PCP reductase family protein [Candidatus Polarisedimenticolaceae bacterium]|nr:PCP reductase family protein [Candidatus Polarisedimenticolaceae bacterium]